MNWLGLHHLDIVLAIAEQGTVTEAARALFISQPAASARLKEAEVRAGTALFRRAGRTLVPTPAGERVCRAARSVQDELARARRAVEALAAGRVGTVRVAAECYSCYHWLPGAVARFSATHSDVEVEVEAADVREPTEAVHDGHIDVYLVATFLQDHSGASGLVFDPLFEDEMVAVVPPDHPWADRSFVEADDFRDEHLIVHTRHAADSDIYRRVLTPSGVRPRRTTAFPSQTQTSLEMVRSGLAVTVMAEWAIGPSLDGRALKTVRVTPAGLSRQWGALWKPNTAQPYVAAFVEALARGFVADGSARQA
ncbi:MAG: LysR family transcriptional regulator [Bacteroidota bacterium]